jgi:hypothetical protein
MIVLAHSEAFRLEHAGHTLPNSVSSGGNAPSAV